jgi:hypothetical protein
MPESSDPPMRIYCGIQTRTLPSEEEAARRAAVAPAASLDVVAPIEVERVEGSDVLLVFTGSGPDEGSLWIQARLTTGISTAAGRYGSRSRVIRQRPGSWCAHPTSLHFW